MKKVAQDRPTVELVVLLAADYANITREGKLNVMGIFDRIGFTGDPPVRHPQMVLVMRLTAGPAEYDQTRNIRVQLINEDATATVFDWAQPFQVPRGQAGKRIEINQLIELRDLIFPAEGTYSFEVSINDDPKGHLPIYVEKG